MRRVGEAGTVAAYHWTFPARLRQSNLLLGYGPAEVLDADLLAAVDASAPHAALEQAWWLAQCRDPINRMIALDLEHTLVGYGLPALARACELAGVDAAFPYLQDVLVAFAARLDPRRKGDAGARDLLRAALRGTLPARLGDAPGGGAFELPFGQWLPADARLKNLAFDSLTGLRRRRILRTGFSDTLLARLAGDPARHGRMVWLLMMLEQWCAQRKAEPARAACSREPLETATEEAAMRVLILPARAPDEVAGTPQAQARDTAAALRRLDQADLEALPAGGYGGRCRRATSCTCSGWTAPRARSSWRARCRRLW